MENTGKVLFGDQRQPEWFITQGAASLGPLSAEEIYARIQRQELTWVDYVWRQGLPQWTRICDIPTFQVALPAKPKAAPAIPQMPSASVPPEFSNPPFEDEEASPKVSRSARPKREWFLFYNSTQFGPFSEAEIEQSVAAGRIHLRVHGWKDGMEGWKRLEEIPTFAGMPPAKKGPPAPPSGPQESTFDLGGKRLSAKEKESDKRSSPRRPLVARVIFAKEDRVVVGVCRDISIGGMQVLTDEMPAKVGAKIKLNISPAGDTKRKTKLKPFTTSGTVVRLLEDSHGFSFRFDRLSDDAKKGIQAYLKEEESSQIELDRPATPRRSR